MTQRLAGRGVTQAMIRTVLFDIDGTLDDSDDALVAAWGAAFRAAGHEVGRQAMHDQIGKGGGPGVELHLGLLGVGDVMATTSADDVEHSKPAPDIFAAALARAGGEAACGIRTVAVRSGGFDDAALAGGVAIYDDVAALLAGFETSPLAG